MAWEVSAALALVFCLLWVSWSNYKSRMVNLPPSPRGVPLVGHLIQLATKDLHVTLQKLSQKHGPIMFLKLGFVPAIVVSTPEMACEVLRRHDLVFASRPALVCGEYLGYNFKIFGIAPYGDYWKRMRRLCMQELFTAQRIDSFSLVRREELCRVMDSILSSGSRIVDVRNLVPVFVINVITRILMNKRFLGDAANLDPEAEEFKHIMSEIVEVALRFHVADYVPVSLRWVDWTIPQLKILAARKDKFFQRIVDQHKLSQSSPTPARMRDFTDIMLDNEEDEDAVKAMIQEMLNGGTHTSFATIEWALAEVLHNPHVLSKAQQELDAVVGSRIVQEADFSNLPYLQCIVKEALRLHPPAPLLVPHMSTEACNVAGYDIPARTTLFVNAYAIGRDPRVWDDAESFIPERFIEKKVDVKGQDFELLPFGSGRRSCPAIAFGMTSVQLALFNFIHCFDWSLAEETDSQGQKLGSKLWPASPFLNAVATPRLPKEAYGCVCTG